MKRYEIEFANKRRKVNLSASNPLGAVIACAKSDGFADTAENLLDNATAYEFENGVCIIVHDGTPIMVTEK